MNAYLILIQTKLEIIHTLFETQCYLLTAGKPIPQTNCLSKSFTQY